jgi:hypothetical protein
MKRLTLLLLGAGLSIFSLAAQTPTATVVGVVKDPSGASVNAAKITIRNEATNVVRAVLTNEEGAYVAPLLQPGTYSVEAEAPGFRATVVGKLELQVDQKARVDFDLQVGAASEVVQVTGEAPLTDTESSSVGTVIDNRKVLDIPLNGRQFYSLALLVPGTYQPAQGSTNGFRGGFNVAGSSEIANNFTVNGITDNNAAVNAPAFWPSIDAIQEFKLLTGVYSAEYGHSSGGQVVVTTKSGTNQYHGTAYEFLRNQAVDAKNYFTAAGPTPGFKRSQFGATAGGPVVRDKTFLFFSYEGLRVSQAVTALTTVPTPAMIQGDFSSLLALATPVKLADPSSGLAFAGNVVPQSRFNRVGQALIAYYPGPTFLTPIGSAPSNNYVFNEARTETLDQYSGRIDHTFSAKDSLYGTFNHFNDPSFEPSNSICGSRVIPGFGCQVGLTAQLYGIVETHLFAPNLVNELRFGYNRLRQPRIQEDTNIAFNQQFGIQSFYGTAPNTGGLPSTTVTNYAALGGGTNPPQDRADNTYQLVDTVIWNRGRHNWKLGTDLSAFGSNFYYLNNSRGSFTFSNTSSGPTTAYALADLLLGLPASTSNNPIAPKIYFRTRSAAVYAQDDYKASSRLTVNFGLRWEYFQPVHDKWGHNSSLDAANGQLVYYGSNGYPKYLYDSDWTNFAPRLGFAWRPTGNSKTVVRGGSGVFYNSQATNNGFIGLMTNPPFRNPQTFTSSKAEPVTLDNPFPVGTGAGSSTLTAISRNFQTATVAEWSAGLQHEFGSNLALDVSYFGSKGTHLPVSYNLNEPRPGAGTLAQVNARRPYPAWGNIGWIESVANSNYNSLQAKVEKRFQSGASFLVSYTLGKSIDDSPGISTSSSASKSTAQDSLNLRGERGLSDFDARQRFVFSPALDLPFGKGRPLLSQGTWSKIAGGFQLSGILTLQSGNPFTPSYSGNISNTYNSADRPNAVGDPNSGPKTVQAYFNTAAFARPAANSFGNAGRNVIQGPPLRGLDLALSRNFRLGEKATLQFRGEFFNALNHPNFGLPNATADSTSFGTVATALDPREIQVAAKIVF